MPFFAEINPMFAPAMRVITAITRSNPAVITTSFANGYKTGLIIRIYVPDDFGMWQINQQVGAITVIDDTSFSVNIDSSTYDAFVIPAEPNQQAQVAAIGEINEKLDSAVANQLP